jgi:hypothetical protein
MVSNYTSANKSQKISKFFNDFMAYSAIKNVIIDPNWPQRNAEKQPTMSTPTVNF